MNPLKSILCVLLAGMAGVLMFSCSDKKDTATENDGSWEETWVVASQTVWYGSDESYGEKYWIRPDGSDEWKMVDANIIGFDYEAGYEYVIVVKVTPKQGEIPQDASSVYYTLVEILSKEQKDSDVPFL